MMNIVQVGANAGNDDAYNYIINNIHNINTVVLIEPLEKHNEILKDQYSSVANLYIENIAIVDNPELSTTRFFIAPEEGQVSALGLDHLVKHNVHYTQIQSVEIPCSTLNKIFDKYNLIDIDYLFIDAEGFDDKIITSIDFNKYNISKIEYENLHIDNSKLEMFLSNLGYKITHGAGYNGWSNRASK